MMTTLEAKLKPRYSAELLCMLTVPVPAALPKAATRSGDADEVPSTRGAQGWFTWHRECAGQLRQRQTSLLYCRPAIAFLIENLARLVDRETWRPPSACVGLT
eukprot:scaffold30973_cov69-Phaeocystis_antarctica.AAC.5